MTNLTELRAALEARRLAEQSVTALRREIITRDLPREWAFSHEGVNTPARYQLGRHEFTSVTATRAEVEAKLREAVRAQSFDRSECPLDVQSKAVCSLTSESVEISVHIEQDEPACDRPEGHEWSPLMDETNPAEFPGGRLLTHGCPHCDGQKKTLWPSKSQPACVVSYEAPYYPEGWVKRELQTGDRPYVC